MTILGHQRTIRAVLAAVALVAGGGTLVACGDDSADTTSSSSTAPAATDDTAAEAEELTVSEPWVRPAPDLAASENTAIYFTITGGSTDDALLSASLPADIAATVEVHETVAVDDDAMGDDHGDDAMGDDAMGDDHGDDAMGDDGHGGGMMTMREVERIEVPAGGTVELAPGGYHVMVMGLLRPLVVGDTVELTLVFEKAGEIVVTAEVREP